MATYLDRIVASHRQVAAADGRSVDALVGVARSAAPARGFRRALAEHEGLAVVAEIKRRSPSKGDLRPDLDAGELATAYVAAGAACVSVLTDVEFFGGSIGDLQAARAACPAPVLRKDFTVDARDIADARLMGADAVLLIAAALEPNELVELHDLAVELGLDALVEVHDEHELEVAMDAGATLVGVNQRDLVTFEVDHDRAARMATLVPDGVTTVAESGVRDRADAARLADAGFDAILVGETLVTATDPGAALRNLLGH